MRDLAFTGLFIVLWAACLAQPYAGALLWAWISMMSPHRLTYGFAYHLPFAQIAAGTTLLTFLFTRNKYPFPRNAPAVLMVLFFLWCCVTSVVSFNTPEVVFDAWSKVAKIQIMLFVTMMLLSGRKHIVGLVWVIALSLAFYGVKGGLFTLRTGGGHMVWGPPGSFIEGTNHIALALTMTVPLLYYLLGTQQKKWARVGLIACMVLTLVAALGTYSRGALLAVLTMAAFLGLKSRRKLLTFSLMAVLLVGAINFLPEQWTEKMQTISTHEDHSAQSRIYTWQMIWNLAMHNPVAGGGYNVTENPETWATYAVTPYARAYSPHSLYFQALAEHGFVGLFLYLALGFSTWRLASRVAREARGRPDWEWVPQLMSMIQVSLIGFAVGGAFVNLVNYDLPYYLAAIVAMVARDLRAPVPVAKVAAAAPQPALAGIEERAR